MCTTIADRLTVVGSGKGAQGWFAVTEAFLGYDHPYHAHLDHALTLDFVDPASGPGARVAVEIDRESARALATRLLATLDRADALEGGALLADE